MSFAFKIVQEGINTRCKLFKSCVRSCANTHNSDFALGDCIIGQSERDIKYSRGTVAEGSKSMGDLAEKPNDLQFEYL